MFQFDGFGDIQVGLEADGQIVGDVLPADGQNGDVLDLAVLKNDQVGGAGADVDQGRAGFFLLAGQNGLGGGQARNGVVGGHNVGLFQCHVEVAQVRRRGGYDVGVDLQPDA